MRALELSLAIACDALFGEPSVAHPLVMFGFLANKIESFFYGESTPVESSSLTRTLPRTLKRLRGVVALIVLVAPPVLAVAWLQTQPILGIFVQVSSIYLAVGMKSLTEHADAVCHDLQSGDLNAACRSVSKIVSRDTGSMNSCDVSRAAIESVLENGSDAVFAPIFWFLLLGAPGAVLYRLANTLDAMWGYKNDRYLHFGWAAARFDDLLNWIPARLTALTYTLVGTSRVAWYCWRNQAPLWYSPNAGPVMASGAGALELELGGAAVYHGHLKPRPRLGEGRAPEPGDITRAVSLVRRGLFIWVFLALVVETVYVRTWR